MRLGQNAHKTETFYDIAWVKQTKILRKYFRNDKSASEIEENWLTKSFKHEKNNKAVVPKKSKHIWKDTNCKNVHNVTVYIHYAIDRST